MARNNAEDRLQIVVCQYLDMALPDGATYWAALNERQTSPKHGAYLNLKGRKAGVSDLMVLYRGKLICIELKLDEAPAFGTKKTYQSAIQKKWQQTAESCGAFYAVCRNTDEVGGSLRAFGVPINAKEWRRVHG